jgi:hypothetical protein
LRQYLTNADVRGRVSAAARTISWAAVPRSAFLGGVLAQAGTARWGDLHGLAIVLVAGGLIWIAATLALPVTGLTAVSRPEDAARIYGRAPAPPMSS